MDNKIAEPMPNVSPIRLMRESKTNQCKTFSDMDELTVLI
jgi:hypothetical protein